MDPDGNDAHRHAVILAGGSGVRFWPRSRVNRPKQLLAPLGDSTLLRRTFDRLTPVFATERIWVLTGEHLHDAIIRELPEVPSRHVVAEPVQRNTGPAIGLATALLLREDPEAVMGVFPSDHHVVDTEAYRELLRGALDATSSDALIVLGVKPRRPETGYGYFELGKRGDRQESEPQEVIQFKEKPDLLTAERFLATGRFYWNSGQFCWRAAAFAREMERQMPETWAILTEIADHVADRFRERLAERYPSCENVSVDHGILERANRVKGLVAPEIGWTDLGSWDALHALLPHDRTDNCACTPATFVDASGNHVDAPGKHVALLGVDNLVVVETPDALLICPRETSQRVGSVVEALRQAGRNDLL